MDISRDLELEKQIDAYIKGRFNELEAEQLWINLFKKPRYIDLLETELHVKAILESQASPTERNKAPVTSLSSVRQWMKSVKWAAAAATIVILVIAINFLKVDNDQTLRELALPNINIVENMAAPDVVRAQKAPLSTTDSLLNLGFKAAISGNVNKALEMYDQIISNHGDEPVVAQAYLNIGIIRYNAGNFEKASSAFLQTLNTVKDDHVLLEKAYWYLGHSYINLDKLQKARKAIYNAYSLDGIYRKPAYRLLRKLDYKMGNINQEEFNEQMKNK